MPATVSPVVSSGRGGTTPAAASASAADDDEEARLLRDADADAVLGLVGLWKQDGNAVAA
jgi:hypothetical protein